MKQCGKLARTGLVLVLSCSSLPNTGCTSPYISPEQKNSVIQQVEVKPYAAFFEGLVGTKMREVAESLYGVAACTTSGNEFAHMDIIRKANKYHQPIIIGGFSIGEIGARNLAGICEKEGIRVDCLILIDGTDVGTIHGNVGKVVDIRGIGSFYGFRRGERYTEKNLKNKDTVIKQYDVYGEHLDIPRNSRVIIESEIIETLRR